MNPSLTIGKVARAAEIGVETIRFYERKGIIEKPPCTESGYRQYPESVIPRLRFIRRAKELGFTLNEIKELLSLRAVPRAKCADVRARAEEKVGEIDGKIATLHAMRAALAELMEECEGDRPVSECPILAAINVREGQS